MFGKVIELGHNQHVSTTSAAVSALYPYSGNALDLGPYLPVHTHINEPKPYNKSRILLEPTQILPEPNFCFKFISQAKTPKIN
jgi:hypothetical protein